MSVHNESFLSITWLNELVEVKADILEIWKIPFDRYFFIRYIFSPLAKFRKVRIGRHELDGPADAVSSPLLARPRARAEITVIP